MNLNFGTAKAYLTGSTGVRNPQTSIIKKYNLPTIGRQGVTPAADVLF